MATILASRLPRRPLRRPSQPRRCSVRILRTRHFAGAGWVRVGSVQNVRAKGVVLLPEIPAYLVANPPRTPIAFLALSTHLGERIVYWQSSMWFEDPAHGTKFDRLGDYADGPAPRGLDRVATLVLDGEVWVNPTEITAGAPRGAHPSGLPPVLSAPAEF